MEHVVVHAPADSALRDGDFVDEYTLSKEHARGVVTLPTRRALCDLTGVSGYAKRAYGRGQDLGDGQPRMRCPLTIALTPELRVLRWTARVQLVDAPFEPQRPFEKESEDKSTIVEKARATGGVIGMLSLASFAGAGGIGALAGVANDKSCVNFRELGEPDADGGWTIGGSARISISQANFYNFALYGTVHGARVVWFAAAQS